MTLLLDTGNSVLIVPRWEDIAALPNFKSDYQILGTGPEPWGCPANIVRGPIEITSAMGAVLTMTNCVFYACTGEPPGGGGERTANFGAGRISSWNSSGWNDLTDLKVVLQSPLSYILDFPYADFDYAPAASVFRPRLNRTLRRNPD